MLRTVLTNPLRSLAVLGLIALGACQAADGTTQAPDTALVAGIMSGLGAINPNEKPIDYKPRAPLAMPSEPTALPPPETKVAGTQSEAWPENEKNPELDEIKELYAGSFNQRRLTPEQMRGIEIEGAGARDRDLLAEGRAGDVIDGERLTRAEMTNQTGQFNALNNNSESAPTTSAILAKRRYLTEPPLEYSVPAANAPLPEVVKVEKNKPKNYDEFDGARLNMRCLEETGGECRQGPSRKGAE